MAETRSIEWTDATWSPITGCSLVSEGCRHCYAANLAATRLRAHPSRRGLARVNAAGEAKFTGDVRLNEDWLDQPLRWKRPRRIFVCAHGDLFHEAVPDEWIDQVFAVMALCPQHTFQVLTKRPERARAYLSALEDRSLVEPVCALFIEAPELLKSRPFGVEEALATARRPLPNVWIGTSIEDQATADARIPALLAAPAALRFVSAEPLLGPVDLRGIWTHCPTHDFASGFCVGPCPDRRRIDWIIVGGESGKGARPMHPAWARSLRDQCAAAGVPFFFKQWGAWAPISEMSEAEVESCYRSRRKAKAGQDQDTLDERFGRRQIIPSTVMHKDGSRYGHAERGAFAHLGEPMTLFEIGKARAGATLAGVLHRAFPEPRP